MCKLQSNLRYLESSGERVLFQDYIGMRIENTEPSPGLLVTVIDPQKATSFLTIDKSETSSCNVTRVLTTHKRIEYV